MGTGPRKKEKKKERKEKMHLILTLLGAEDNLNEAPDFFNRRENILGITISCMVWYFRRPIIVPYGRFAVLDPSRTLPPAAGAKCISY